MAKKRSTQLGRRMDNKKMPKIKDTTPSIHPLEPYSAQSIGAAKAISWAIGNNPGWVANPTQDTQMAQSSQQAGTHFSNLRRMTG